jgi:hypothetical protein
MLNSLRDLLDTLLLQAKSVLSAFDSLEIVHQDEDKLILRNSFRDFEFNKRYRAVKSGTRAIAQFDAIKTIDVRYHRMGDDPDYWSVTLNVKGLLRSVIIGRTGDEANAAIVAARIGTMTGRQVRSL